MGTEAAWVPLVLAAVSAGAEAYNQNQVASQQHDIEQSNSLDQQRKQREADALVNERLGKLKASTGDAEREQSTRQFLDQLQRNRAAAGGGPTVPTGSDRYAAESAGAKAAIGNYGDARARLLGAMTGPMVQRQHEAIDTGRMTSDIGGVARDAQALDAIAKMRLMSVRANPWVTAASRVGSSVAGGMASGGYGMGGGTLEPVSVGTPRMLENMTVGARRMPVRTFGG